MSRWKRWSAAETEELFRRYGAGESLAAIGDALARRSGSVHLKLLETGGIPSTPRRRSDRALSMLEREEISRGLSRGISMRRIAASIGRNPSTVSREIARNGGTQPYRAAEADARALRLARRPKICKLARHPKLRRLVASKLRLQWSPEQISGSLRKQFPDDEQMNVSHETIYRSLFIQARGVLKKELQAHLRSPRVMRRVKKANRDDQRGRIPNAVSIRERPASVEDRAVPGHWEGDLLSGKGQSYIATLVERASRFTMLVKVDSKETAPVVAALTKHIKKLPAELRRSLTWDRGHELSHHKALTIATDVQVYFCDPQSPWQRGTNENTNGLLRQYFPKGTDLSLFSQAQLNAVAARLNGRPRKTLDFNTPADTFAQALR